MQSKKQYHRMYWIMHTYVIERSLLFSIIYYAQKSILQLIETIYAFNILVDNKVKCYLKQMMQFYFNNVKNINRWQGQNT